MVELLGRYSNHADQGTRLASVLGIVLKRQKAPISKPKKQVQRRLKPSEVEEVVIAYQAGSTLYELAERFRIHRVTVSHLLERHDIPTRYRLVQGDRLQSAVDDGAHVTLPRPAY